MDLREQVVSLSLACKLKTLGIKQQSAFAYWLANGNALSRLVGECGDYNIYSLENKDFSIFVESKNYVSAFTVAELGGLLPDWCSSSRNHDGEWEAYPCATYGDVAPVYGEKSEADARGKLLIAIIEKYPEYPDTYDTSTRQEED